MKTKFWSVLVSLSLILILAGWANALTIQYHEGTTQLEGLTEVPIYMDGETTYWDMTSSAISPYYTSDYDTYWSSVTPYSSAFAEAASDSLYDLFNDNTSELSAFRVNPQNIWTISGNPAYLITPSMIMMNKLYGYQFNTSSGVSYISGLVLKSSYASSNNHYLFLDWTPSDIGTGGTGSDPVPEPATLLLLGSGLAGLAFYRRKRK